MENDNIKVEPKEVMIEESTWEEFKSSGMLWVVNTILQIFGWSLVFEYGSLYVKDENTGKVSDIIIKDNTFIRRVYPVKNKFRGFSEDVNDRGYYNITNYIVKHSKELLNAVEEGKNK